MWTRRPRSAVRLTPGFLLLAGILLYLDQSVGILLWGILASVCHEIGHVLAARRFGGRVERLSLTLTGAELRFSYPAILSYGGESLVALAGPAVNLLLGAAALCLGGTVLAMTSMAMGLFNLLPVLPLDGGRILFNLVCELSDVQAAERVLAVCGGILAGLLSGIGLIAALHYANPVLLMLSGWLLAGVLRNSRNFSPK